MLAHHAAPMPTGMRPPASRSVIDGPSGLAAIGLGSFIGVALGWWCRSFAYADSVNGVLANLGAPWVVAAFVAGAIAVTPARRRRAGAARSHAGDAVVGALAGTMSLVVATVVYYGPARTGSFDFGGAVGRTAFWTMVGVAVGVVFGATGALWRVSARDGVRSACLGALGIVIVGEAAVVMAVGTGEYDGLTMNVVRAVSRTLRARL